MSEAVSDVRSGERRFSLVLPAYNTEQTVGRAIESVLAQSYQAWELIVIDDGSTDSTRAVAEEFAARDPRVRVVTQPNAGCAGARRAGALLASGEFVTKLDADDELLPSALAELSAAIADAPGYDIYSANGWKVAPDGTRTEIFGDPRFDLPLSLTLEDLIDDCWIFGGAASIRRGTLERLGGFRGDVRCEDYELWLRALANGATHRYVPVRAYLWYVGRSGRMNEFPEVTFESYIRVLTELQQSDRLTDEQRRLVQRSIDKLRVRIAQLEETGTTDADYTNEQARRFRSGAIRLFGERGGRAVVRLADRLKWVVRPVRVALARRARRRDGGRV